jgi:ankyrin repeat protein
MCTNKNLFVDMYSLMTKETINEMIEDNSFVEIIYKLNNTWRRECHNRNELLKIILKPLNETTTIWNNGRVDDRVKAVYKLPYTGEYIIEDAIRYLSCPWFKSFLKVECQTQEIGTYFGVSMMHGSPQSICKLVPLIEVTDNLENLNFNDPSILKIQLPKLPEYIWTIDDAPDEFPEEKQALEQSNKSAPVDENLVQKTQRQNEVRTISRTKKIAELEYDDNKLEKETKIYKVDRLVISTVLPDISNPHDPSLNEMEYLLLQIINSFKNVYTVKERPEIEPRYSEKYYFVTPKSPEEIFFNMDKNRIEKRCLDNNTSSCKNKLVCYIDEQYNLHDFSYKTTLNNGQKYKAHFTLHEEEDDDMFSVKLAYDSILEGNIDNYQLNIFSFNKFFNNQPVNQFTKEQYMRIAGLLYLITHPVLSKDLQPGIKNLLTLLSMGIDIKTVFLKNSTSSNLSDAIDLYKNIEIHNILSRFDDYYNITKNLILFYYLEKEVFANIYNPDLANEDYPAILSLIPTNVLSSIVDSDEYTALHYIIFNEELTLQQVKKILIVLKDEFNMDFSISTPENLITSLLIHRKIYTDDEEYINDLTSLIQFLIENGVDVNNCRTNISNLHRAIRNGDVLYDIVKLLIDNGADINAISSINYTNITPLEFAQYYSEINEIPSCDRIIELLASKSALKRSRYATLEKENNEVVYNIYKITDLIKESSTDEEVNFIILNIDQIASENKIYEKDNVDDTLMTALLKSHSAKHDLEKFKTLFEYLLNKGYDINYKTSRTLIHLSIYYRLPMTVIDFILSFNPDINIKGLRETDTPLTTCMFVGDQYFELFKKLINMGAEIKPYIYESAKIYLHAHNRCRNIYNYLLRYQVKPYIIQGFINRTTPISFLQSSIKLLDLFTVDQSNRNYFQGLLIGYHNVFSERPYMESFKQLYNLYIKKGGDPNYVDNFGNTVLTTAIINKTDYHLIKYLIEEVNIDVHTVTIADYSLIDLASQHENYSQVISLLQNHGVRFIQIQQNNESEVIRSPTRRGSTSPPRQQRRLEPPPVRRRR